MPKKQPDNLEPYAQLKREITQRVAAIAVNGTFPVTGDRNYILEADGTIYIQAGPDRPRAVNRWRAREWAWFAEDCRAKLWERLEAWANS